jgi:hypothetical protein
MSEQVVKHPVVMLRRIGCLNGDSPIVRFPASWLTPGEYVAIDRRSGVILVTPIRPVPVTGDKS